MNLKDINLKELPWTKILLVGQFLIILLLWRGCGSTDNTKLSTDLIMEAYKGQSKIFSKSFNKQGQELSTQKQLVLQRDKKLEEELLKNSNLQQLNTQIKVASEIKIKNILATYSNPKYDTLYKDGDTILVNICTFGTKFDKKDKWYSIYGSIEKEGVKFDSISFMDSLTINIGRSRQPGIRGFFKKKDDVVEVIRANPYGKTIGMNNIHLEDKIPWYDKGVVKFTAGILAGFAIDKGVGYFIRR